jgi:plastocyanin
MLRLALASLAVAVLVGVGAASAAPSAVTLTGTVGPGFTITLKRGGAKVTQLKANVAYRVVINDKSSSHNFHLTGPGYNRQLTTVSFTGTKTFTLKFTKKGTYTYVCDPHASSMKGTFRVA